MRTDARAWLMLASLCAATPAWADWMRDYDRGVKAAESGDWQEAASYMRSAMQDNPKSNERQRFQGVRFDKYLPHHYAGLAAWRQGDCETALDFWNDASNQAAIGKVADLQSQQQNGVRDCTQRLAQAAKPADPVAAVPDPAPTQTPSRPVPTPAQPTPTRPAVQNPVQVAQTPPRPSPPAPTPAATPSAGPAPAALRGLVEQWVAGRYDEMLRVDPSSLPDNRARAHGFLLRAAAHFTRAKLSTNPDSALEAARRDVRAARAAMASLSPDRDLYSPRFRAFYTETR